MPNSIAIRLNVEGGAESRRVLDDTGNAGQAAFQKIGTAADQSGVAADRQTAKWQRLAQAAREAERQERAQANVNALLGVKAGSGGSARASASVFEGEFSRAADFEAAAASADRLRAKFDPLFRAQQAYRADLAEMRGALASGVLSQDAFGAALDRRKAQFAEQVAGLGRMTAAQRAASQLEGTNRVRAEIDPVWASQEKLNKSLADAERLRQAGLLTQEAYTAYVVRATEAHDQLTRKIQDQADAGQRATAQAAIQARDAQGRAASVYAGGYQRAIDQNIGIRAPSSAEQSDKRQEDFLAAAEAADRLRAKYDPLFRAQQAYRADLDELREALASGVLSQDAYGAAMDRRKAQFAEQVASLNSISEAQERTRAAFAGGYQRTIDTNIGIQAPSTADESAARQADFEAAAEGADRLRAKFDPLFAAQRAYRADLTELRSALSAGILTEDAYSAALERRKAAFTDQVAGLGRMTPAQHAAAALGGTNGVRAEIDPVWASQERLDKALADAKKLRDADLVSEQAYTRFIATQRGEHDAFVKKAAANQNGQIDRGLKQGLTYQSFDVFTTLYGGMSPALVAAQQGPQVAQLLMDGNGVKSNLAAIGKSALGLVTPFTLAGTAVAGLGTAFAVAASQAGSEREGIEKAVGGIGRATGTTVGQLELLARKASDPGKVTTGTAREIVASLAATGEISLPSIESVSRSTADFARTTGTDIPTATAQLAVAFADPARGADQLAKSIGGLDDRTRQLIRTQAEQGNTSGAQATLAQSLDATLQANVRTVTGLAAGYEAAATAAGKFWDATKRRAGQISGAAPETAEEALARLNAQVEATNRNRAIAGLAPLGMGSSITRDRDAAAIIADTQRREAEAKSAEEKANKASIKAGDVARSLDPMGEQLRGLEAQRATLQAALADPFARSKLDDVSKVEEAFARVSRQIATMREDMEKFGSTSAAALVRNADFALKTVGYSPLGRATAEAQRAYNEGLESRQIAPIGPTPSEIENRYRPQFDRPGANFQDLYRLSQARDAEMKAAVEREGLQAVKDKEVARAQQEALRTSATSSRYSIGVAQVPEQYRQFVLDSAGRYGQDPDLMAAMLRRESRFSPNAVSRVGAQGIAQFMPETAERFGLTNPFDPQQSIDRMGRYLQVLERQFGGNTADMVAAYNRGEGAQARWIREGRDPARVPKETRGYLAEVFTPGPGTAEIVREQEARRRGLETEREALRLTTEAGGRDRDGTLARIEAMRRVADEQGRGIVVTREYAEQIGREAQERQRILSDMRFNQYAQDSAFQREQLGRTEGEARGAYVARSMGYDLGSPQGQAVMETERMNEALRTTKQVAGDAFTGLLTDLRRGTTLASSLETITGRIADRVIGGAADSLMSGLFASEGKSGGGWITSALASARSAFGFDSGGYTGAGGKYDVAGLVHRGEVVFSQADIARHGGVAAVELLRRGDGLPSFADGGFTGPWRESFNGPSREPFTTPRSAAMQAIAPAAPTVVFQPNIIPPPGYQTEIREARDGRGDRRPEITFAEVVARGIGSRQGQQALRTPRVGSR